MTIAIGDKVRLHCMSYAGKIGTVTALNPATELYAVTNEDGYVYRAVAEQLDLMHIWGCPCARCTWIETSALPLEVAAKNLLSAYDSGTLDELKGAAQALRESVEALEG